jgi:hypothetical protein
MSNNGLFNHNMEQTTANRFFSSIAIKATTAATMILPGLFALLSAVASNTFVAYAMGDIRTFVITDTMQLLHQ